jgi:SAM-dependent methyltransferase
MRPDIYQAMARVEDGHWWFRARRSIITSVLASLRLPPNAAILDAGSGTGGNLAMLSSFGRVSAMELDEEARELANKRGIVKVEEGEFPSRIPFEGTQFDLVAMFDVLEHIEQDFSALTAIHARMAPEGKLLLTVPAFESLWSMHDSMHHHKRRYSLHPLIRLLERAGYTVTYASYINFWLFPLIATVRVLDRITGGRIIGKKAESNAELSVPPASVNSLLEKIFASEATFTRKRTRLPFGVSIIVLAQKA